MGAAKNRVVSEKFWFYHTNDVICGEKFGLSGAGIALSRSFDESPLQYTGDSSVPAIIAFAWGASIPVLINFSEDYIEPIFNEQNPTLFLFTEEEG